MHVIEIVIPCQYSILCCSANFNPSITRLPDGTYLISLQSFRRFPVEYCRYSPRLNHPWLGGVDSDEWWKCEDGGWTGTAFMRINIAGGKVNIERVYRNSLPKTNDTRLINWNSKPLAIYSEHVHMKYPVLGWDRIHYDLPRDSQTCCDLIKGRSVIPEMNSLRVGGEMHPCKNISFMQEWGWTPWTYQEQLYFSYRLTPKHTVFKPNEYEDDCNVFVSPIESIYTQIEEYYRGGIEFFLGTPAISLGDRHLAVGYLKLYPERIRSDTNCGIALEVFRDLLAPHPKGDRYFMFFYTFNPETLDILESSHAFLPLSTKSNVVVPAGLTNNEHQVIVSYGEEVSIMKLLFIDYDELRSKMHRDITPENFSFILY